jgi:type VI protein secretion system component VasF
VTSPKNKAKKRVELALQYDEEKQYKLAEKELKMKKLNDEAQELLKHKNMLRAMENKKRLDEIKQQNEREINEYAERLKKEKHQLQVCFY